MPEPEPADIISRSGAPPAPGHPRFQFESTRRSVHACRNRSVQGPSIRTCPPGHRVRRHRLCRIHGPGQRTGRDQPGAGLPQLRGAGLHQAGRPGRHRPGSQPVHAQRRPSGTGRGPGEVLRSAVRSHAEPDDRGGHHGGGHGRHLRVGAGRRQSGRRSDHDGAVLRQLSGLCRHGRRHAGLRAAGKPRADAGADADGGRLEAGHGPPRGCVL